MGLADLPRITKVLDEKGLSNILAQVLEELAFIINGNLDVKNIRAKSITADRLTVEELSAISANLGHIIAGLIESVEIYGSYIATRKDAYPRVELNSDENLFGAYKDAAHALLMRILEGPQIPALEFRDAPTNKSAYVYFNPSTLGFSIGVQGSIDMTATDGNVQIAASGSGIINLISYTMVNIIGTTVNINGVPINSTLTNLQTQVNGKANVFSGYTGSVVAGTKTLNFSNGILTSVT